MSPVRKRRCPRLPRHEPVRRNDRHAGVLHRRHATLVQQLDPPRAEHTIDARFIDVAARGRILREDLEELARQNGWVKSVREEAVGGGAYSICAWP